MTLIVDPITKQMEINRGDRGTFRLTAEEGNFMPDDKIVFSIIERQNYNNVVFQKEYIVLNEAPYFDITLTKEDTRIGPIISNKVEYWYEVEYNGDQTLIGFDRNRQKKFILYPEAPIKKGGSQ